MTAVALRVRSDARRRWRAWVSVALLIGVGAGAAMALAQGARRTRGAYPRFADAQHAADIVVTGKSSFGLVGAVDLDQVDQLPAVAASARAFVGLPFTGTLDDGRTIDASDVFPVAALDRRLGHDIEDWKLLTGRRAAPDRVDEAVASFELADRLHLHVGSEIDFRFYAADHFTATAARLVASWPQRLAARHAARAAVGRCRRPRGARAGGGHRVVTRRVPADDHRPRAGAAPHARVRGPVPRHDRRQ